MSEPVKNPLALQISGLMEAWFIRSGCTNMPFVECNEETMNDQVFLFAAQKDAEAFCEARKASGHPLSAQPLKSLPMKSPDGQPQRMLRQVLSFLMLLPSLDVDVVCYQAAGEEKGHEVYVSDLLPDALTQTMQKNAHMYNPLLQLTGIFFAQAARLPKEYQDAEELRIAEEEFSANLVKATFLVTLFPPDGTSREDLPKLKPEQFRFPVAKNKNDEMFLPIFTDMIEAEKWCRGRPMVIRPVPFTQLHHFYITGSKGYLLNPTGYALPLLREKLEPMAARFGLQLEAPPQKPSEQASPAQNPQA